jgi:hypothetical protein
VGGGEGREVGGRKVARHHMGLVFECIRDHGLSALSGVGPCMTYHADVNVLAFRVVLV